MAKFKLPSGIKIGSALGITLLVIGSNLDSPPAWLLLLGWLTLGIIALVYLEGIPQNNPYKEAFYLLAIPFLFYAGFWGASLLRSLFDLLSEPSAKHLMRLFTGKPFLWLAILYLVCLCISLQWHMRGKGLSEKEDNPRWREGKGIFELGKKKFLEGHMQEALNCFDQAIKSGFSLGGIYGFRGCCLQNLDFHFDAIDDFNQGIFIAPADSSLYYMRSLSRRDTGDLYGSMADLKEAIRLSKRGDKMNEGFELLSKDLGWDSAASYYESQLAWAATYLEYPDELLGRNLRKNLQRRAALVRLEK